MKPYEAAVWSALGDVYTARGQGRDAIEKYGRALTQDPNHLDALLGRAMAHYTAADYAAAIKDFEAAFLRAPDRRVPPYSDAYKLAKEFK
jgi:tetratricopeptide (TPR) repeat protein